jgi:hypothetical protein
MMTIEDANIIDLVLLDNIIPEDSAEVIDVFKRVSMDDIVYYMSENSDRISPISACNIPQFSNIRSIPQVLKIVESYEGLIDYRKIGYFFNKDGTDNAKRKYGENHYKLVASLGLVTKEKPLNLTPLYYEYKKIDQDKKDEIKAKLMMNIPIVQCLCCIALKQRIGVYALMLENLSESTATRRRSSVKSILHEVMKYMSPDMATLLSVNLKWGE